MSAKFSDQELTQKAKLLHETSLLGNGTDELVEKQLVFYVLAGIKPLSEVVSLHMEEVSEGNFESVPDDQAQVKSFLGKLGLCYEAVDDGQYLVSLDKKYITEYLNLPRKKDATEAFRTAGTLFGYPATAVEACVQEWVHNKNSLLTFEEQDEHLQEAGLPVDASVFRFSRGHYKDEIAEVKRWYETLQEYDMITATDGNAYNPSSATAL